MATEPGLPPDQVDWDALGRHFAGEGSAEDADAAARYLAEHPEEGKMFASLERVLATMQVPEPPTAAEIEVDKAWRRIEAEIEKERAGQEFQRPPTKVYAFAPRRGVWRSPAL